MQTKTLEAIYEHGVFRPLVYEALDLEEGQSVRIVIESVEKAGDILALAAAVYEGLDDQVVDEIEAMLRHNADFFGEDLAK